MGRHKVSLPPDSPWLTLQGAAQASGVTYTVMSRLVKNGKIPSYRVAKSIRLKKEDVAAFANPAPETRKPKPPKPPRVTIYGRVAELVKHIEALTCRVEQLEGKKDEQPEGKKNGARFAKRSGGGGR